VVDNGKKEKKNIAVLDSRLNIFWIVPSDGTTTRGDLKRDRAHIVNCIGLNFGLNSPKICAFVLGQKSRFITCFHR